MEAPSDVQPLVRSRLSLAAPQVRSPYRQLFEQSPVPQLFADPARRVTEANRAAGLFYGYRRGELAGMPLGALSTSPEDQLTRRLGQALRVEPASFHAEHRLSNGSTRAVEVHATPVETEAGMRLHLLVCDVTPSLLARETSERSGRLLDAILDSAPIIVFAVDRDERLRLATGKGLGALPRRWVIGRPIAELYADEPEVIAGIRRAMAGEAFTATVAARGRVFECTYAPLPRQIGRGGGVLGVAFDVTAFKQTEEALRASNERLHHLAAGLQLAREKERRCVARTVHDVVGQALTAAQFEVAALVPHLDAEQSAARAKIEEAMALLEEAVRTVQAVATELRPDVLDRFGLVAALREQAASFEARTSVRCSVVCEEEAAEAAQALGDGPALALYRIAQEALTNVVRHAGASEVRIGLVRCGARLVLEVEDDGRGIEPDVAEAMVSLGLVGMWERAEAWGGHVRIGQGRDCGTRVRVEIPIA